MGSLMVEVPEYCQKLFEMACQSDCLTLISGETGTGKTSLARLIHAQSARHRHPFLAINLATLHEGVLESELFGHERGAFTGASVRRVGKLELAEGGSVLLDEIGELPLRLQARLLDFLQNQTISPVGSNREIKLNVRVFAATHKDLEKAMSLGEFRKDLFYRLRVIHLPLRSLKQGSAEDFLQTFERLWQQVVQTVGKPGRRVFSPAAWACLQAYDWPGNLRELKNVMEFVVLASQTPEVQLQDLPDWLRSYEGAYVGNYKGSLEQGLPGAAPEGGSLPSPEEPKEAPQLAAQAASALGRLELTLDLNYQKTLESLEREFLRRAFEHCGGQMSRTASEIGMNKTTFLRRMRDYGLKKH